jgi:lipoprotein-anchoring transpeptidase ErfK/SrfK
MRASLRSPHDGSCPSPTPRRLLVTGLSAALAASLTVVPAVPALAAPAAAAPKAAPVAAVLAATKARTLRQGMRGADVKTLQRRLAALKYDIGPANGVFGLETRNAVVAFQKVNGLGRDGVVGPKTRARLARPATPKPRYKRKGVSLEANLAKQVLYVFNNGKIRLVVNISSGNGRRYTVDGVTGVARTPRGRFRIQRYVPGWRKSRLGMLWRPMYFSGGYAVHGSSSVPPYPASHGCIRTPIATQNRLIASGLLKIGRPFYVFG